MTPIELKQWQARLGLSELAMAHYLGVPVHTLRKWLSGERSPDAAPRRLFAVLQRIERDNPVTHGELVRESRQNAPERAPGTRGRPRKGTGATMPENAPQTAPAPQAPENPGSPEIPAWLRTAL